MSNVEFQSAYPATAPAGTLIAATLTDAGEVEQHVRAVNIPMTAFGEILVGALSPQAAWRFDYGVNTRIVTQTTANSASITSSGGKARLSTGTNSAGSAKITTIRRLRYLPGLGGLARFTAVFGTARADSTQIVGIGDDTDGFFFGYDGTTFGVMRRRSGTDTWTAQADWNGDALSEALNTSFGNIYQIRFQWLGYGLVRFYIFDKGKRDYVLVHTILYPNTSADTSILNPTLPLQARVVNTGNTNAITLDTPSAMAAVEGTLEQSFNPLSVPNSYDATATVSSTAAINLVTIRNKSTAFAGGDNNRVPVQVTSIDLSRGSGGAASSIIRLYRNAATSGALTYADISTNDSPVQASATGNSITSTNAERTYTLTSANLSRTIPFAAGELILQAGDSLTLGTQNATAAGTDFSVNVNWQELF